MVRKTETLLLIFSLACAYPAWAGGATAPVRSVVISLGSGQAGIASLDAVRGRPVELTARTSDGSAGTFAWSVTPANAAVIQDSGNGRVRLIAIRDAFDMPDGQEPRAEVKACVGTTCAVIAVSCLVSVQGRWTTLLDGTVPIPIFGRVHGTETRHLTFVQDGRRVVFDAEPGHPAALKLVGKRVDLIDPGDILRVFSGEMSSRDEGGGQIVSVPGFVGTWKVKREQ